MHLIDIQSYASIALCKGWLLGVFMLQVGASTKKDRNVPKLRYGYGHDFVPLLLLLLLLLLSEGRC